MAGCHPEPPHKMSTKWNFCIQEPGMCSVSHRTPHRPSWEIRISFLGSPFPGSNVNLKTECRVALALSGAPRCDEALAKRGGAEGAGHGLGEGAEALGHCGGRQTGPSHFALISILFFAEWPGRIGSGRIFSFYAEHSTKVGPSRWSPKPFFLCTGLELGCYAQHECLPGFLKSSTVSSRVASARFSRWFQHHLSKKQAIFS